MSQILVILPTYNEAGNILRMLDTLFAGLKEHGLNADVLVVDDSSPDGTGNIVKEKMATRKELHLLSGKKKGLGKAYMRGFDYALGKIKPDIIVMMDSDFSHDPKAIPSLVAEIDNGADYVIGSRYTEGGAIPGDWPLRRIVNSRVANFVAKSVGGIHPDVKDVSGGFKAIRASKLECVDWQSIRTNGYAFQMHLLYTFMKDGAVVREVPITFGDRRAGSSKLRSGDIFEFIRVAYGLNPQSPVRQLTRFLAVGGSGIIVNLGVLALLANTTKISLFIASSIAIEISILTNFLLHNSFTFQDTIEAKAGTVASHVMLSQSSRDFLRKLVKFNVASLGTATLSLSIFAIFHGFFGVYYLLAQLVGIVAAFFLNYQISSRVIWKQKQFD